MGSTDRRRVALFEDAFPERPRFDTAVSRSLLLHVAERELGEGLRLYAPDDAVLFSVLDATRPGFAAAVEKATARRFAAVMRLVGGSAAVFARETLAFAWSAPAPDLRSGIQARFEETSAWIAEALDGLGVDARIGEIPGEYCPGDWSVNARGRSKLMGVGQRVVRGAAHVGGVLVVGDADRIRDVLLPVYDALGLPFDPETVGSVRDELGDVSLSDVRAALVTALARRHDVVPARFTESHLERAGLLEPDHAPSRRSSALAGR